MPSNKRVFYAVQSASFAALGETTYTLVRGLQSIGTNVSFNLEQSYEIGQIDIYSNDETIPSVEVTMSKVLDGEPLIYHLATKNATSPTLAGRSNERCIMGLAIYTDTNDAASGTPLSQSNASGLYVSSLSYTFNTQGPSTEEVTLVGNDRSWSRSYTQPNFHAGTPHSPAAAGGIARREDVKFGESDIDAVCILPPEVGGVTSSGTVPYTAGEFAAHVQRISVSTNLGREELFELGRRGPYHRFASFPVEVRCDIECYSQDGDGVEADEESESNTAERTIIIRCEEGIEIDLGSKNRLSSVTYGGADAGQGGGNATQTYSFSGFNHCTVSHPEDPAGL